MGQWFIGKIPLDMEIDNVIDKKLPFNPPKHYGGLESTFQYSLAQTWFAEVLLW